METTFINIFWVIFCCLCSKISAFNPIFNVNKSQIIDIIDTNIKEKACSRDLKLFIEGLSKFELWAMKMFDASAKLNAGLLYGNAHLVGNYDQCLSISQHTDGITGQYCTAILNFKGGNAKFVSNFYSASESQNDKQFAKDLTTPMARKYDYSTVGFYVPKSCTADDLNRLWSYLGEMLILPAKLLFIEEACSFKEKKVKFERTDFFIFFFFAAILAMVLGATIYDVYSRFAEREANNILISFSLYTNTKKLITIRSEQNQLTCLHGIKVLTITKIVVFHNLLLVYMSSTNMCTYMEWSSRLSSTFITESYPTDTSLVVNGILVTYYLYMKVSEKNQINFFLFCLYRLIRLIPAYVAVIMVNISVIKYLGNGPLWYLILAPLKISCERSWFINLLFINNIINLEHRCISQSWYLSVDLQLYIVSFFILYYLKKNPKKTLLAMIGLCVCSIMYTIYIVVTKKIGFVIFLQLDQEATHYTYFSPLSRIPSWLVGMFYGYFLHRQSLAKISFSKGTNYFLWILSLSTILSLIFYHSVLIRNGCDIWCSIFFNGFSRIIWSSAMGFVIFSCSTKGGGFINEFLSHPVFVVLGRLTFCIFLIHNTVISVVLGSKRQSEYFSTFILLFNSCGMLVLVLLCSAVLYLVFEIPLQSLLTSSQKQKGSKTE